MTHLYVILQGLVLVFDVTKSDESFAHLSAWEDFIQEVQPSVLVCVANKADLAAGVQNLDAKRDTWIEWCFDHGLEMVECSALKDQVGAGTRRAACRCFTFSSCRMVFLP